MGIVVDTLIVIVVMWGVFAVPVMITAYAMNVAEEDWVWAKLLGSVLVGIGWPIFAAKKLLE